jgi:hypothetical protein
MKRNTLVLLIVTALSVGPALAAGPTFSSRPATNPPSAPLIMAPGDPVSLVLDDGVSENNIGLNDAASATMFEWFNRFSPTELPIDVERIDVYWDSASAAVVGGEAIELVVYESSDTPCSGATIQGGQDDTIATLDAFDQYTLTTPATITTGPSVSLGVIDRWVTTGVTAPMHPAAIDTTAGQARSFVTWWATDPPVPPVLPGDQGCDLIDTFGFPGNWLIRGAGTVVPVELQRLSVK